MRKDNLEIALYEATRFIARAKEARAKYKIGHGQELWVLDSPGASAAVKRASLDLTKALAKLRRESR